MDVDVDGVQREHSECYLGGVQPDLSSLFSGALQTSLFSALRGNGGREGEDDTRGPGNIDLGGRIDSPTESLGPCPSPNGTGNDDDKVRSTSFLSTPPPDLQSEVIQVNTKEERHATVESPRSNNNSRL